MGRKLVVAFLLLSATKAFAGDNMEVLKTYCEKNSADHWAKNSESCRLVRDELKLDQLCDGYSKGHTSPTMKLESIAEKLAELKSSDSDSMIKQLCSAQIGPDTLAAKPECIAERGNKSKISRKWWNGSAWVGTQEGFESIKAKATSGDRLAQFNLGMWYMDGSDCVARDIKIAAPLICKSYDAGEKMAGLQILKITNHPSTEKARELFGKNYGCENTERQNKYAVETKKLEDQAKAHLKKAESGDIGSMVKVGIAYLNGDINGGKDDPKLAFTWFKKAAEKGNSEAMGLLGSLYNRGDGVEKNNEQAFKWSLKAAQKGDLDSQYFVGLCYYDGQGTEEDLTKAVQWLNKAMDQGHSEAKEKLISMYESGELQSVAFKALSERLKKLESKK